MKLVLALTLLCLCQLLDASPVIEERDQDAAYEAHKAKHNLSFEGAEDDRRRAEFKATDDKITAHNADPTKTSELIHNKFSTMHVHEVKAMNGYKKSVVTPPTEPASRRIVDRSEPTNLDWRDNNGDYVSDIQNQGNCGSCWTFSASAALESRYAIKNGLTNPNIPKLSEQCLVDCAHYGSTTANTCATGGDYNDAWSWVASIAGESVGDITGTNSDALPKPTTGQNLLSKYPYVDGSYEDGDAAHSCGFATSKGNDVSTTTYKSSECSETGYSEEYNDSTGEWEEVPGSEYCAEYAKHASYSITANSTSAMKTALQNGPVSVSIYAAGTSFQNYGSGILQEADCPGEDLDHAVNLIGYGEDSDGNLYWLGRNSWDTDWGLEGYFKFERKTTDSIGTCGVLREGAYPAM